MYIWYLVTKITHYVHVISRPTGWLDNAGSFDRLIPLITVPSLHLVAIDLPGHGLSSHRPPGTNQIFVNYLADIRRVVEGEVVDLRM